MGLLHALAQGVDRADAELLPAVGVDMTDPAAAVARLQELLSSRLTDPSETGLADFIAQDETDTFTAAEIAAAGLDLGQGTPEQDEFDAVGMIPKSVDMSPQVRTALAETQLRRPGDAADEAGWNHSASDLRPALAVRALGIRVTVVDQDGNFQDFGPASDAGRNTEILQGQLDVAAPAPSPAPDVVMRLSDGRYQLALPVQAPPARATTPLTPPAEGDTTEWVKDSQELARVSMPTPTLRRRAPTGRRRAPPPTP